MKYKFLTTLLILSTASILGLTFSWVTAGDFTTNTNFEMEILYGDPSVVTDFRLEGLTHLGATGHNQVTWEAGTFNVEETRIDPRHNLTSAQLESREMFRHMSQWAGELKTEHYWVRMDFHRDNFWRNRAATARVAVKDLATGNIRNEVVNFPGLSEFREYFLADLTSTEEGRTLLVLQDWQSTSVIAFEFDVATHTTTLLNEFHAAGRGNWMDVRVSGEYAFYLETVDEQLYIHRLNLLTGEQTSNVASDELDDHGWLQLVTPTDLILIQGWNEQTGRDMYHLIDFHTGEVIELPVFPFHEDEEEVVLDEWGWAQNWLWSRDIIVGDQHIGFVYVYSGDQRVRTVYTAFVDIETLELVFSGAINIRADHHFIDPWQPLGLVRQ